MFFGERSCNPDDGRCTQHGGICERLAEVIVVGPLELVLDDDEPVRRQIPRQDIRAERAYRHLAVLTGEIDTNRFTEQLQSLLARYPWGEMPRLVRPALPQFDGLQVPEMCRGVHRS